MRTPPCPPPERPDSKDGPVPGDYHIEDAIGIRVLQRVAVRVDRQVDLREILTVSLALEDELPLLKPHANAFPGDAGHLRGQENRGFGQDDVDERIAGADLLALEGRPRSLGTGFAGPRRESVDERLAEDAELPLEGILEHAMKRAARLLELVLDAHWGILPSLIRTAFAKGAVPSLVNPVELMVYRFHIVFARTDFPSEVAARTVQRTSRGRFCLRGGRRFRRRGRFRGPSRRRRRGGRRLRGARGDASGSDHRDPLDEHPVPPDAYELHPFVHHTRRPELELVVGQDGFARFGGEDVHLPLRVVRAETLHDLLDAAFLVALHRG